MIPLYKAALFFSSFFYFTSAVEWLVVDRACTVGYDAETVHNVLSVEACQSECMQRSLSLPCKSCDYRADWNTCYLSSLTKDQLNNPTDYDVNCLNHTYAEILSVCSRFECSQGREVKVGESIWNGTAGSLNECGHACLLRNLLCSSFSFESPDCRLSDADPTSSKYETNINAKSCKIIQ